MSGLAEPAATEDDSAQPINSSHLSITPRSTKETSASHGELRYHALFEQTSDAVFIISLDGIILETNTQALHLLKCDMQDILHARLGKFVAPGDIAYSRDTLSRLKSGEHVPVYERHMQRKDGEPFTAEINAMLVRDAQGEPLYIQSLVRDVSERRKHDETVLELALRRERQRLLTQVIEDASHHFRTPLANIKTSAYLIQRFTGDPAKRDHQLDVLGHEIERLSNLLDDLLKLLRLQQTDLTELEVAPINLKHFLEQLIQQYQYDQALGARHQWHYEPDGTDLSIVGNRPVLQEAFEQVLNNACQYTPAGKAITVRTRYLATCITISIIDQGVGINESELTHIFDSFYRTDSARAMDSMPSGLGLPITERIVELHGGQLRIRSKPDVGTTVCFFLPHAQSGIHVTEEDVERILW